MKYEKWNRIALSLNRWPTQWWHYGRNAFFSFELHSAQKYILFCFICVRCGKMVLCLFCFGILPSLRVSFNALLFAFMDKANTWTTMKSEICVSTSSSSSILNNRYFRFHGATIFKIIFILFEIPKWRWATIIRRWNEHQSEYNELKT